MGDLGVSITFDLTALTAAWDKIKADSASGELDRTEAGSLEEAYKKYNDGSEIITYTPDNSPNDFSPGEADQVLKKIPERFRDAIKTAIVNDSAEATSHGSFPDRDQFINYASTSGSTPGAKKFGDYKSYFNNLKCPESEKGKSITDFKDQWLHAVCHTSDKGDGTWAFSRLFDQAKKIEVAARKAGKDIKIDYFAELKSKMGAKKGDGTFAVPTFMQQEDLLKRVTAFIQENSEKTKVKNSKTVDGYAHEAGGSQKIVEDKQLLEEWQMVMDAFQEANGPTGDGDPTTLSRSELENFAKIMEDKIQRKYGDDFTVKVEYSDAVEMVGHLMTYMAAFSQLVCAEKLGPKDSLELGQKVEVVLQNGETATLVPTPDSKHVTFLNKQGGPLSDDTFCDVLNGHLAIKSPTDVRAQREIRAILLNHTDSLDIPESERENLSIRDQLNLGFPVKVKLSDGSLLRLNPNPDYVEVVGGDEALMKDIIEGSVTIETPTTQEDQDEVVMVLLRNLSRPRAEK